MPNLHILFPCIQVKVGWDFIFLYCYLCGTNSCFIQFRISSAPVQRVVALRLNNFIKYTFDCFDWFCNISQKKIWILPGITSFALILQFSLKIIYNSYFPKCQTSSLNNVYSYRRQKVKPLIWRVISIKKWAYFQLGLHPFCPCV